MKCTTLLTILLAMVLVGCRNRGGNQASTGELSQAKAYAAAEVSIEQQRKLKNADWSKITETFQATLPVVRAIDKKHALAYETEINAALATCAKGEDVKVNQQVLAKGLQHVTVLAIKDELAKMSTEGTRKEAAAMVEALFEGIRPTFTRRDKDFFGNSPTLEPTADDAIQTLKNAEGASVIQAVQSLQNIIDRTYALCVYYEFTGVEAKRGSDAVTCAKKMKEAEYFYRVIADRVRMNSKPANALLSTMVTADFEKVDSSSAETALVTGLGRGMTLK